MVEVIWIFVGLTVLAYIVIDTAWKFWSHTKLMEKANATYQEDVNRLEVDFEREKQEWQREKEMLVKENEALVANFEQSQASVRELMSKISDLKVEYRNKFEELLKFSKN